MLQFERWNGVGGPIEGLHWWGVTATYDDVGELLECPLNPGTFTISMWAEDEYAGRPDFQLGALYTCTASAANGLTKIDTGLAYAGSSATYTLWAWDFELLPPFAAFRCWISIQNTDLCQFWWAGSPVGDGVHVVEDQSAAPPQRSDAAGDLSYCLTADDVGPFTGACCDTEVGVCQDTDATECAGPGLNQLQVAHAKRGNRSPAQSEARPFAQSWAVTIAAMANRVTGIAAGRSWAIPTATTL